MRLWHQALIHYLPRQQLLGQHRECCALRGKGWGKKHSVVDYVFKHSRTLLYAYHCCIMNEMNARGYKTDSHWDSYKYRGKCLKPESGISQEMSDDFNRLHEEDPDWKKIYAGKKMVYFEHDDNYLKECLDNLEAKNAELVNGETIAHMKLLLAIKRGL